MDLNLVKEENTCTVIAVRYQFIYNDDDGMPDIQFVPHEVQKCEIENIDEAIDGEDPKLENVVFEDDVQYLRSLDPKEWKKQDHYKVLGIKNVRFEASEEVIKNAYRRMVLKHHPDKRKAMGEEIRPDDDYYTCITMAYETLGNFTRKRAYDSVDPEFDNTLPSTSEVKDNNFFEILSYYFKLNSRWSENSNVPKLGDMESSREEVDKFYTFWYNFKSWREYSYEDEEDKDKCSDRDERRMCDKINKAERQRKKKEEMVRIRSLVDLSYNADPRIAKFKQEDKDRKLAAKRAKQTAAQAKKEEEERMMKELQEAKEKAEAAERARMEAKRLEREAQKKALKRERKTLRDTCKASNYFSQDEKENLTHMQAVDKICEIFSLEDLEDLNKHLQNNGRNAFIKAFEECEKRIEAERQAHLEAASKSNDQSKNIKNGLKTKAEWTTNNIQLLIKAVNVFPAGTNQRWEVVANFINQHGTFAESSMRFNAKDVLAKAKDLQNTDFSKSDLKEAANKQAFSTFEKEKRTIKIVDNAEITEKIDGEMDATKLKKKAAKQNHKNDINGLQNGINNLEIKQDIPWTATEQQLLEQALKTYSSATPDRWDKIAECIPNRSKKDCMKRYKELVEIVKAKKAAQNSSNAK